MVTAPPKGSRRLRAAALSALWLLAGCGGDWFSTPDPPLPGERIAILTRPDTLEADERIADLDVELPRPVLNEDWAQEGGTPNHAMHHLAAPGSLETLWRADIGDGSGSESQLLAQPVIAGGRVYTLDTEATVSVFDAETGESVWTQRLAPEDDEGILGGGIAVYRGRVFVTTGFAQVIALDVADGKEVWRRSLNGPVRAAPTAWDGRVFVVTVANELFALSVDDGRELWTHAGLTEAAGLLGGAAPAIESGVVVVPYSSGEVAALRVENGRVVWTESLTALRRSDAVSAIAHIRGRPVIDRGVVYIVANSKRMAAVDLRTGTRLWERPIGGLHGPWVAGEFIYVVTRDAELICLTRRGGRVRWVRQLPRFEDEEDQEDPILWTGPVLAGNRLILAATSGDVWSISPYTGKVLGRIEVSDPVLISPAVARETIYLLTDGARLIAFR